MLSLLSIVCFLCLSFLSLSHARAIQESSLAPRNAYPFARMVAFGDELSDNGNGSFAHGITGDPATVYGFGTWTNGPVAASYLADMLGIHLRDYAFGGCCGGGSFGATFDNAYTQSPAGAQSMRDQIANYTTSYNGGLRPGIENALRFLWFGENDLSAHTDAFWPGDPHNSWFAGNASSYISGAVGQLLDLGAPYVFVANIYPKHIAPVTAAYLCGGANNACTQTWGQVIQEANSAISSALGQFGDKVIYYDVFSFLVNLANNAASYGFTQPLTSFCDGDGDANWQLCMVDGHGDEFFWMNFVQPTTRVHQMIAADMKTAIDQHFGFA